MRVRQVVFIVVAVISIALGGTAAAEDETDSPVEDLRGTWGATRDFGPEVHGALLLRKNGRKWFAEISGYRVDAISHEGVVSFEIPGDRGNFRGHQQSDDLIVGQWIQPGVVGMFGQRFSTPVHLEKMEDGLWRGKVTPLQDQASVFMTMEESGEGKTRAWLRNPQVNFGRFFDFTDLAREADRLSFRGTLAWRRGDDPSTLLEGVIHDDSKTISLFVENLGGTYDLHRIDESSSHFFPRAWAKGEYEYRPPAPRSDGWETAKLESVGMSREPLEAMVKKIVTTPMDAIDAPYIDAVLVARHGKLVLEEYFHGHGPERPHDTRSASKSITAMIVGAAIHAGFLSLHSKVYETMYRGAVPGDLDSRASRMTVEHLITMSSGLACDDWDDDSPGNEDRMQNQPEQPDWYQYILDLPMLHEPGEKIAYCSGGMSLAGGVVARASGMLLTEFFDQYLARPLQMGSYHTNLMPTGEGYAGGGLRLTGRDFLKFGQLLLDDGVWRGRRVVDEGWTSASIKARSELGTRRVEGYGYGWWLIEYDLDGKRWPAFYAGGNGGNYIIGVPDLDLVIVFLASNYNQSVMHETKYEYVPEFILRSVLDGERSADSLSKD